MIITCEKCKTRYRVADESLDKPVVKVRCCKCNYRFMVYKPVSEQPALLLEEEMEADHNRIITISNQKGGVAKTSTCLNLGMSLVKMGKRVLVVDFDVQANLTILLGLRKTPSFYDVLQAGNRQLSDFITQTRYPGLSILPSSSKMALMKKKYLNEHNYEYLLRDRLQEVKSKFDHILIDTPPSIEFFTINALVSANLVIIPTTCEYLSVHGITQITDIIGVIKKDINKHLTRKILITKYNPEVTSDRVMFDKMQQKFKGLIFKTTIEVDDKMRESHIVNMPVLEYAKQSKSASQYLQLAEEICQ